MTAIVIILWLLANVYYVNPSYGGVFIVFSEVNMLILYILSFSKIVKVDSICINDSEFPYVYSCKFFKNYMVIYGDSGVELRKRDGNFVKFIGRYGSAPEEIPLWSFSRIIGKNIYFIGVFERKLVWFDTLNFKYKGSQVLNGCGYPVDLFIDMNKKNLVVLGLLPAKYPKEKYTYLFHTYRKVFGRWRKKGDFFRFPRKLFDLYMTTDKPFWGELIEEKDEIWMLELIRPIIHIFSFQGVEKKKIVMSSIPYVRPNTTAHEVQKNYIGNMEMFKKVTIEWENSWSMPQGFYRAGNYMVAEFNAPGKGFLLVVLDMDSEVIEYFYTLGRLLGSDKDGNFYLLKATEGMNCLVSYRVKKED